MGEALKLAVSGPATLYAMLFGLGCLIAEVFIPYHHYAGYLKLLTSVLLVYVAAAFSLHIAWGTVLGSLLVPTLSLDHQLLLMIVAIFGTTLSPYLFFWQASQEAEESRLSHRGRHAPSALSHSDFFSRISFDTWIGMFFANLIAFFIIVTTAATLHANGITKIESASQAAEALRPIAGELTFALFAAGIIGTGLLAVPVLAGSAAYAVADVSGLRGSLELPAGRALGFYAIVGGATLGGAALTMSNIDPVTMLFWTAVINGIVAVPIMAAMMILVSSTKARLVLALPRWVMLLGWAATALMALAVGLLAWSSWP
jgi:Mn2+/Fe2+ NRAMP family transporter